MVPPDVVGTVPLGVNTRPDGTWLRFVPKILTISPGATELVACKLAPLVIALSTGVEAAVTVKFTVTVLFPPAMLGDATVTVPVYDPAASVLTTAELRAMVSVAGAVPLAGVTLANAPPVTGVNIAVNGTLVPLLVTPTVAEPLMMEPSCAMRLTDVVDTDKVGAAPT